MGQCGGKESDAVREMRKRDKQLNSQNKKKKTVEELVSKVLLLGTGESGKSTVFKQMKLMEGKPISDSEMQRGARMNISFAINELLMQSKRLSEDEKMDDCALDAELYEFRDSIHAKYRELGHEMEFDPETVEQILAIWADSGIQQTFANRALYQLHDNVDYFMDNLQRIVDSDWELTEEDIVRVRVRTTGLVRERFDIDGTIMEMLDVGGQRNERKKWIHQFDDVKAVIFVTALSEYDLKLFEDDEVNRMHESLQLFQQLSKSHWFANSTYILFLNKRDLFEDKFPKVSLSVCFDDWNESNDVEYGIQFIADKFQEMGPNNRDLIIHVTTATNKGNIRTILTGVRLSLVTGSLSGNGLM